MGKYLFIVNPIAGSGRTRSYISFIDQYMKTKDIEYKMEVTTKPGEATKIVEDNPLYGVCVAVGGDGTANEVAKGILNRGHGVLGIIPSGTGNDLAQALSLDMDKEKAMDRIFSGKTIQIDLGRVRDDYFFNISSIGFDAWVVRYTDMIKKVIKGKTSYVLGVIVGLLTYRSKEITIEIDGKSFTRKATLVAVGNGQSYGGGMKILPMAEMDDSMFDICVVKDISNLKILFLFPSIFKGEHVKYKKHVEFYRGKEIRVILKDKHLLNIDGDLFHVDNETVIFNMAKERLSVIK